MKFGDLFDNIVVCAQEAKTYYELNAEGECFNRLDEIVKSINLIRDFHEKYESMRLQARMTNTPVSHAHDTPGSRSVPVSSRRGKAHPDEGSEAETPHKRQRKSDNDGDEIDLPDDEIRRVLEAPPDSLDKDLRNKLELQLLEFLEKVCSNEDFTDSTGAKLHHTLAETSRPRKSLRDGLTQSYRLRIGPLINAFTDEVKRVGLLTDDENLPGVVRGFLNTSRFFKRFNFQGRRIKMRGVHVWIVEASTSLQGRWRFQDYPRHFITEPVRTAAVGQRYTYVPRVWDPELCEPEVIISAPHLPSWLALVNNMLVGVPPDNAVDVDIRLVATILPSGRARKYRDPGRVCEQNFKIHITRPTPGIMGLDPTADVTGDVDAASLFPRLASDAGVGSAAGPASA